MSSESSTVVSGSYSSPETFLNDIPESLAYDAHAGTSWVPERRAITTRSEYASSLVSIYNELLRHAGTPEKLAVLDAEFARFREGYQRRYRAYLLSRSRVVSWAIAGPSNFPVSRMEKRNGVAHRRLDEFLDFQKRAVDAIKKTLHPEWRPIMSGDADAVERLEAEVQQAEAYQERMKEANKVIRSKWKEGKEAIVFGLVAIGLTEIQALKLMTPDSMGGVGYQPYKITNNGANLRRLKARLEHVRAAKQMPTTEAVGDKARLEDCPAENRVRLFFPGKPEAEVRNSLKTAGFRWAPTLGAWQAYRSFNNLQAAKRFAGIQAAA